MSQTRWNSAAPPLERDQDETDSVDDDTFEQIVDEAQRECRFGERTIAAALSTEEDE